MCIILKLICPIIVLLVLWEWNRRRRKKKVIEESDKEKSISSISDPHIEFNILGEIREKLKKSNLIYLKEKIQPLSDQTKAIQVLFKEEIIAIILYSWPTNLWSFREEREEEIDLSTFSHIHYIGVLENHRNKGYFYKLMDMVISDTHKISSGITIDLEDPELKELFRKKFEFLDCGNYMKLDYGNWS